MEAAVVGALLNNIVAKLGEVLLKKYEQSSSLEGDIQEMISELELIAANMEDYLLVKGHVLAVQRESMKQMRRLAFDIEDCLDRFLPCVACEGKLSDRMNFVLKIEKLKKRVQAARSQKADYGVKGTQQASNAAGESVCQADSEDIICHHVGIDKPKQKLRDLLLSSKQKLVISVVGLGGSGKTTLAKAVYDCDEIKEGFQYRAWAAASRHKDDIRGLLTVILQQLLPGVEPAMLRQRMRNLLRDKSVSCLIVIDDYEKEEWNEINSFFSTPTIRIVVTTRLQSVANACSSGDGYIYNMRTLSEEDSKILLRNMVSFFERSELALDDGSEGIVHKCDGHPLALISVANHLNDQRNLTKKFCQYTSRILGLRMEENKNNNFTKLRQVLMNTYSSLPDNNSLKTCLLYTSLFPNDRPVSRQTLTCRWLAEGYIECQGPQSILEAADDQFEELCDRNIIKSIEESNNGKVKTCKYHGIMHQFILHRSTESKFITSFGAQNRSNFRHLVIENHRDGAAARMDNDSGPATNSRSQMIKLFNPVKKKVANLFKKSVSKKLRPRSLTIFGSADEAVYSDITNLQLLRVLDLKECSDFQDEHLEKIYKLMHLKYLSLGRSITNLSDVGMKRLHRLETLDLRKTMIRELPLEIIILPHLSHLFGKIKLNKLNTKNLDRNLLTKSKLHTVSGVVIDNNSAFPELMGDMKQLKKVKIWCETTSTDSNYTLLSEAIHKFGKAGIGTPEEIFSLSLHLNDSSNLLNHYQGDNTNAPSTEPKVFSSLSSLKLHGRPSQFEFCKSMCCLAELCLTSTNLTELDLPALRTLEALVCLKLVQDSLEGLQINSEDFKSLQRLCLVVKEPRFPTIAETALPVLTSIQLLCGGLKGPGDIKMKNFKALCEVALDSMLTRETIQLWEDEAKNHPKRPKIVLLKRVDPADISCAVKYVATDQIPSGPLVQGTATDPTPSGPPVQGMQ